MAGVQDRVQASQASARISGVRKATPRVAASIVLTALSTLTALTLAITQFTAVPAAAAANLSARGPAAASSGSAVAWGDNHNGQLGDGTVIDRNRPVKVLLPTGTAVTALATGGKHSLALTSAGTVLAWGSNHFGQLGNGSTVDSPTPVQVAMPNGTVVTAIAAGGSHSLAVTAAGQVFAWGDNEYGQLGDGTTVASDIPVRVRLAKSIKVIAVRASYNYSVALTAVGHVLTWGYNGSGQLGNGFHTASEIPTRVRLPKGTIVRAIASGGFDGLALTRSGRVLAWGDNRYGQLGDGTRRSSDVPVRVRLPVGTKVVALGGGSQHSLALTSTGKVLAWGWNRFGQLGDGTSRGSDVPVHVRLPSGVRVTALSAGGGFSVALTSTGQILTWGHNEFGQLGDGGTASSQRPVKVSLPAGLSAVALAAGPTTRHNLAVVSPAAP